MLAVPCIVPREARRFLISAAFDVPGGWWRDDVPHHLSLDSKDLGVSGIRGRGRTRHFSTELATKLHIADVLSYKPQVLLFPDAVISDDD